MQFNVLLDWATADFSLAVTRDRYHGARHQSTYIVLEKNSSWQFNCQLLPMASFRSTCGSHVEYWLLASYCGFGAYRILMLGESMDMLAIPLEQTKMSARFSCCRLLAFEYLVTLQFSICGQMLHRIYSTLTKSIHVGGIFSVSHTCLFLCCTFQGKWSCK